VTPISDDPAEIIKHMRPEEGDQVVRLWMQLCDSKDPLHKLDPGRLAGKTDEELRVLLDEMIKALATVLRVRFRQAGLAEAADLSDADLFELAMKAREMKQ
jgi:hypothetical protein